MQINVQASLFSNPGMTVITRAMRRATMLGTQNTVLPLGDLGLNFRDGYYTYQGSLTSPPCNQVVRWIVLKRVLHIRNSQVSFSIRIPNFNSFTITFR